MQEVYDTSLLPDLNIKNKLIKEKDVPEKKKRSKKGLLGSSHIKPKLKLKLKALILSLDKSNFNLTSLKFLIGILIVLLPVILLIIFLHFNFSERSYTLPFIISVIICMSALFLLFFLRLLDDIKEFGYMIPSWERNSIFKIFTLIIRCGFILGITLKIEDIVISLPDTKKYVLMSSHKDDQFQELNFGYYLVNLFFILYYWDIESFEYDKLPYFYIQTDLKNTYEKKFFKGLVNLILIYICFYCFKKILIKSKNDFYYFFIIFSLMFECVLYEIHSSNLYKFTYDKGNFFKVLEILPLLIILIFGFILAVKRHIFGLCNKKFSSHITKKTDICTVFFVILSFIIIITGLIFFFAAIIHAWFTIDIHNRPDRKKVNLLKNFIWTGFVLFFSGSSFIFGDYVIKILFKPIVYGMFNAQLKNENYIKINSGQRLKNILNNKRKGYKNI